MGAVDVAEELPECRVRLASVNSDVGVDLTVLETVEDREVVKEWRLGSHAPNPPAVFGSLNGRVSCNEG